MRTWSTLFSDASRCPRTGACGWGGWVKHDSYGSRTFSGSFKVDPDDIQEAELQAIAKTIHSAARADFIERGGGVLVQSESSSALSWILAHVPGSRDRPFSDKGQKVTAYLPGSLGFTPNIQSAVGVIKSVVEGGNLCLYVRHVRGHKGGDGRNAVNRQCDDLAKEAMILRRVQLDVEARDRSKRERSAMVRTAAGQNVIPLFRNVDISGPEIIATDGSDEVDRAIRAANLGK